MDDLFMIFGFLLLFVGLPASIITTIVFAVKKKKVKVPAICITASLVLSFSFLVIGAELYSKTEEYKQSEDQQRDEVQKETEIEREDMANQEEVAKSDKEKQRKEEEEAERKKKEKRKEEKRLKEEKERAEKEDRLKKEKEKEEKLKFSYNDGNGKFLEWKIEENEFGGKCLVLYFEFTNNNSDSQAFGYLFSTKAFQNGVELDASMVHVNEETRNSTREVQEGTTVTVAEAFEIGSDNGDIEIEITPFNIWSDKILFEHEFSLE